MSTTVRAKELAWNGIAFANTVFGFSNRAPNTSDAILTFHSVGEPGRFGNVSPEKLRNILQYVRDKYALVDLPAVLEPTPEKRVAVTFDDGWENFYHHALPVLEELGAPATIFLVSEYLGSDDFMSYDQVTTVVESEQVTIGNHTRTHPYISRIGNRNELENQIEGAKDRLESQFGVEIRRFAYPRGDYTDEAVEIVRGSHDIAVTTMPRVVDGRYAGGSVDPCLLPRVKGHLGSRRLRWELTDLSSRFRHKAQNAGIISR